MELRGDKTDTAAAVRMESAPAVTMRASAVGRAWTWPFCGCQMVASVKRDARPNNGAR